MCLTKHSKDSRNGEKLALMKNEKRKISHRNFQKRSTGFGNFQKNLMLHISNYIDHALTERRKACVNENKKENFPNRNLEER